MSWNTAWMALAHAVAAHSKDPKVKVGCVIVTADNEAVLSIGYNGDERGGDNLRTSMDTGGSGFIHAETNALIKMPYTDNRPRKAYLTHAPCVMCAKQLVNARIDNVYYGADHYDDDARDILARQGIGLVKV